MVFPYAVTPFQSMPVELWALPSNIFLLRLDLTLSRLEGLR